MECIESGSVSRRRRTIALQAAGHDHLAEPQRLRLERYLKLPQTRKVLTKQRGEAQNGFARGRRQYENFVANVAEVLEPEVGGRVGCAQGPANLPQQVRGAVGDATHPAC
eukprot:205450-Pyramimonas_sp.AAC.1